MNKLVHFLPLLCVLILVISLYNFLEENNGELNSALVEKNFPSFSLSTLKSSSRQIDVHSFNELPALINVWATWCIACKVEHPFLMELYKESVIPIYGLNYKDNREKAIRVLDDFGDPYKFSIFDLKGKLALDLGVYGAPETFLVDENGVIKVRHVGVLNADVWEKKFKEFLNE